MTDEIKEITEQVRAEQIEQNRQELNSGLEKMLFEVKRKLKGNSKNELIRLCCALLVENYSLKQLAQSGLQETNNEIV